MKLYFKKIFQKVYNNPVVLILLLTFLIYFNSLSNDFVNLDDIYFLNDPVLQNLNWTNLKKIFNPFDNLDPTFYHPFAFFFFSLEFQIWNANPFGYHLTSLILFMVNLFLVYTITLRLFKHKYIAVITTFLYAAHPLQAEPVCWAISKCFLFVAFFCFMSFYFFLNNIYSDKNKKLYYIFSIFLFFLALFTHPIAPGFPFLLLAYFYCFPSPFRNKKFLQKIFFLLPYFLFLALYILILFSMPMGRTVDVEGITFTNRLFTAISIFGKYFKLLLWPYNLSPLYTVNIEGYNLNYSIIFLSLFCLFYIFSLIYTFFRDRELFFPLFWFLIFYIPVSNFIIWLNFSMSDRYLYIPVFGIYLVFSILIHRLFLFFKRNGRERIFNLLFYAFFIIIIVCLFTETYNQSMTWKNSFTLWSNSVRNNPNHYMAHLGLALEYDKQGLREDAISEYEKVISLEPSNTKALVNLAANYYAEGRYDDAILKLREALSIEPELSVAGELLRVLYNEKLKARAGTEKNFNYISIETGKLMEDGNKFMASGNMDKASVCFENALMINPFLEKAYCNLISIYENEPEKRETVMIYFFELFPDRKKEFK